MTDEERKAMRMALEAMNPDPHRAEWAVAEDTQRAIKAVQKCLTNDALNRRADNAKELGLEY